MKHLLAVIFTIGTVLGFQVQETNAALSLDDAVKILGEHVLLPSSGTNAVNVLMSPTPLTSGIVEPMFGGLPSVNIATISGNPQWFSFIDLEPCAFFEHDVIYAFIDDVTGVVTTNAASDWPEIDGIEFGDGVGPGQKLIRVYGLLSEPFASTATPSGSAVTADYGDAPDGEAGGFFPTLYDTTNSAFSAHGGHTFPSNFALGNGVSTETGASDPADSDGTPNLNDADSDERMFIILDPNPATTEGRLLFDAVSISSNSVFLNILSDVNLDGTWSNEWALVNDAISLTSGTNTYVSTPFSWLAGVDDLNGLWARIALTAAPIPTAPYGTAGWDGSGNRGNGEIEDVVIQKCPSGGGGGGPPEFNPEKTPPPGPKFGWSKLPVNYFSLVIQGPDHKTQQAAMEAGETMLKTLKAQGYNTPPIINGANATADNIEAEIIKIGAKAVCQDHILIYFVAHGKKNTPGGKMALAEAYTGAQLNAALNKIPPCKDLECNTPGTCCNVSVIIESCYSGQFIDATATTNGRAIFTASSSTEPARFGSDGSGGQYSDGYSQGTKPGSGADTNPADGVVTPEELHDHAAATSKKQTEQKNLNYCDCLCPSNTWDCVASLDGFGLAFPGDFSFSGSLLGSSFPSESAGIPLFPGMDPIYDSVAPLEINPDAWEFPMVIFNNDTGQTNDFIVSVTDIPPEFEVFIPIPIWIDDPFSLPPQPFHLQIDLSIFQYQILDDQGNPLMNGSWETFLEDLMQPESLFAPSGIERLNFLPPQPLELQIESLSLQSAEPVAVLTWPAQEGQLYDVFVTENLADDPFIPLNTNLTNTALMIPTDTPTKIFKVEAHAPVVP